MELRRAALGAFAIGVLLHLAIAVAVLGSGGKEGREVIPRAPAASNTPQPTKLPDRTNCSEIRGTDYRSETERQWFQRNCITSYLPAESVEPVRRGGTGAASLAGSDAVSDTLAAKGLSHT